MQPTNIQEVRTTGEEVYEVASAIEPVLLQFDPVTVIIALLNIVISIQNPDLTPEQMQDGVKGSSQWICLWLDSLDQGPLDKKLLN